MPYELRRAPMSALLKSMAPCLALCACTTSMQLSQAAPPCAEIVVASQLLEATAGASLPASDTVGEIAAFGVRQTGQLDRSNADKSTAKRVLTSCDAKWREAIRDARPRRWWQVWR